MQFDRYIFRQMLRTSFAVMLTLVGIMWLFQTIRILELVINRGAPMTDFLLMSVTVIPLWLTIAIPISVFVAVMWVFHRALVDRELLVAQASGRSAIQLARAPIALGQTTISFETSGIIAGSMVLAPLTGSIAVITFCKPMSYEKRYSPVAASRASRIPIFPTFITAFRFLPPTATSTICRSKHQSRSHWSFCMCC